MNTTTTTLPQVSTATRLNAVFAAAIVTLAMLSGINQLAAADTSASLAAQPAPARQA